SGKTLTIIQNENKKMKFSFILLATLGFMSNTLQAKESKTDEIFKTYRFSLYVGPTFNSLKPTATRSDNYVVSKGKTNVGFNFGIGADYNINDRYTIYSGLGMDWRGGALSVMHDSTQALENGYLKDADVKYKKMQYLSVPLGLKMKAVEINQFRVFAQTGLDLGILLSQKGDYTIRLANDSLIARTNEKLGGTATVVPVNMGWCIGAGTEYTLNDKNAIYATILYRNGFIDATTPLSNDLTRKFSDGNIRSNSVVIRIGYFF
ncbi:MAG TPA: porin family protein, partial [Chitinophagaceae bacterium]|nr:porin family protein [Chitinophagaceae bacterium]